MNTQLTPDFVNFDGRLPIEFWASMSETKPAYELIEGVLQQKPLKRQREVRAVCLLMFGLASWGDARGWSFLTGGLGLCADDFNGFVPDAIGFAPATGPNADEVCASTAFLVAEIPAPTIHQRDAKKRGYARAEVELYLVVDALAKTIEVYRLDGETYGEPKTLTENAVWEPAEFAGLELELARLWM